MSVPLIIAQAISQIWPSDKPREPQPSEGTAPADTDPYLPVTPNFSRLPPPALEREAPAAAETFSAIDEARVALLRQRIGDLAKSLQGGQIVIRFTTDERREKVKEFFVYYIASNKSEPVLWYTSKDGVTPAISSGIKPDEARDIFQQMLVEEGHLGALQAQSAPSRLDKEVILPLQSFMYANETAFLSGQKQLEEDLEIKEKAARLAFARYRDAKAAFEKKAAPYPLDGEQLSSLAKAAIEAQSRLRDAALNILFQLPTKKQKKEKLSPASAKKANQLETHCSEVKAETEKQLKELFSAFIGQKGENLPLLLAIRKGNWNSVEQIEGGADKITYLFYEDVKRYSRALDKHLKFQAKFKKDGKEEDKKTAEDAKKTALERLAGMYELLKRYESDFAWVPGVKERGAELREQFKAMLDLFRYSYRKEMFTADKQADATLNRIGDKAADINPQHNQQPEAIAAIKTRYTAAEELSNQIGDNGAREVLLSMILSFSEEAELDIASTLKEIKLRFSGIENAELEALGEYYILRSRLSEKGLDENEMLENHELAKSRYGSAKRALDKMEDWQTELKRAADKSQTLEKQKEQLKKNQMLLRFVQNFFYSLHQRVSVHNLRADKKETPCEMTEVIALASSLNLPKNVKELKKIFRIISEAGETKEEARRQIARQMWDRIDRSFTESTMDFYFAAKAQTLTITPLFISLLERETARKSIFTPNQLFLGRDIRPLASSAEKPIVDDGYYVLDAKSRRVFQVVAPDMALFGGERAVGGGLSARTKEDLLEKEKIAVTKLFIMGRGKPVSYSARFLEDETIVAAFTSTDIRTMIALFGAGNYRFKPDTFILDPYERGALETLAKEHQGKLFEVQTDLIKKLLNDANQYFSDEEMRLLDFLSASLSNADAVAKDYSHLPDSTRLKVVSAAAKLALALPQTENKGGLNPIEIEVLEGLAVFMEQTNLQITDPRLLNNTIIGFSQGKEAIAILRKIHRHIQVLASKYPAEDIAEGAGRDNTAWEFIAGRYVQGFKKFKETALSTLKSASFYLSQAMSGLMQEQTTELNLWLETDDGGNFNHGADLAKKTAALSEQRRNTDREVTNQVAITKRQITELHTALTQLKNALSAAKENTKSQNASLQGAVYDMEARLANNAAKTTAGTSFAKLQEAYQKLKQEVEALEEAERKTLQTLDGKKTAKAKVLRDKFSKEGKVFLPPDDAAVFSVERLQALLGKMREEIERIEKPNRDKNFAQIYRLEKKLEQMGKQLTHAAASLDESAYTSYEEAEDEDSYDERRGAYNGARAKLTKLLGGKPLEHLQKDYKAAVKELEKLQDIKVVSGKFTGKPLKALRKKLKEKREKMQALKDGMEKEPALAYTPPAEGESDRLEYARIEKEIARLKGIEASSSKEVKEALGRLANIYRQIEEQRIKNWTTYRKELQPLEAKQFSLNKASGTPEEDLAISAERADESEDSAERARSSSVIQKNIDAILMRGTETLVKERDKTAKTVEKGLAEDLSHRVDLEMKLELMSRRKSQQEQEESLGAIEGFINEAILSQLKDTAERRDAAPQEAYQLLVQVEQLEKMAVALKAKIKSDDDFSRVLASNHCKPIIDHLISIFGKDVVPPADTGAATSPADGMLPRLRAQREELTAVLQKKDDTETELRLLEDRIFSDRFDADKWQKLRAKLEGLYGKSFSDKLKTFVGETLTGKIRVPGYDGEDLGHPIEFLDAYFKNPINPPLRLSTTLPHIGEADDTVNAKMALTMLYGMLKQESRISIGTSVMPALTRSIALGGLLSGVLRAAGDEVEFGPSTPRELDRVMASSTAVLEQNFLQWAALNSNRFPATVISAQIHLTLAGIEGREEYKAQLLAKSGADQFNLRYVSRETIAKLLAHLETKTFPLIQNNSTLQSRLRILFAQFKLKSEVIFAVLTNDNYPKLLETITASLPEGDFKLYDSLHADKKMIELARLVEDLAVINEEINRSSASVDYRNEPITFFDPGTRVRELAGEETAAPKKKFQVGVVKEGETDFSAASWPFNRVGEMLSDAADWAVLYGGQAIDDFDLSQTGTFGLHVAEGAAEAFLKFQVEMRFMIGMGLAGMGGDIKDFAKFLLRWDKTGMKQAAINFISNSSETIGSFLVFELAPWLFYDEAVQDWMQRNYGLAVGKAAFITWQSWRQMRIQINLLSRGAGYAANRGVLIHNYLRPNNPWTYRRWGNHSAVAHFVNSIRNGTAPRLLAWTFGLPVSLSNAGWKAYKYSAGNTSMEVRPDIQMTVTPEQNDPLSGLRNRYHQTANAFSENPWLHPLRSAGDVLEAGKAAAKSEARMGIESARGSASVTKFSTVDAGQILQAAQSNRNQGWVINLRSRAGKPIPVRLSAHDLLELSLAKNQRDTMRIFERIQESSTVFRFSDGTLRDVHALFQPFRQARENLQITANPIPPQVSQTPDIIRRMARGDQSLLRGSFSFTVQGGAIVTVNGSALAKILSAEEHPRRAFRRGDQIQITITQPNGNPETIELTGKSARKLFTKLLPEYQYYSSKLPKGNPSSSPETRKIKNLRHQVSQLRNEIVQLCGGKQGVVEPLISLKTEVPQKIAAEYGRNPRLSMRFARQTFRAARYRAPATTSVVPPSSPAPPPTVVPSPPPAPAIKPPNPVESSPLLDANGKPIAGSSPDPQAPAVEPSSAPQPDSAKHIMEQFKKGEITAATAIAELKKLQTSFKITNAELTRFEKEIKESTPPSKPAAEPPRPAETSATAKPAVPPLSPPPTTPSLPEPAAEPPKPAPVKIKNPSKTAITQEQTTRLQSAAQSLGITEIRLTGKPFTPTEVETIIKFLNDPVQQEGIRRYTAAQETVLTIPKKAKGLSDPVMSRPNWPGGFVSPAGIAKTTLSLPTPAAKPAPTTTAKHQKKAAAFMRRFEAARAAALSRIDSQPISDAEKATLRAAAIKTWDAERPLAKKWARERAQRPSALGRAGAYVGRHAPLILFFLAENVIDNYKAMLKGDFKNFAEKAEGQAIGLASFAAAEAALSQFFKISKGVTPLAGAVVGGLATLYGHREALTWSPTSGAIAAVDTLKEAAAGAVSAKAFTFAATKCGHPVVGLLAGIGAAAVTYGGIRYGGQILGYDEWLNHKLTREEVLDQIEKINYSGTNVTVTNAGQEDAFLAETLEGPGGAKISQAQDTLAFLGALKNWREMSPQEQRKYLEILKKDIRALSPQEQKKYFEVRAIDHAVKALEVLDQAKELSFDNHAGISPDAFFAAAEAVRQFHTDYPLESAQYDYQDLSVKLFQTTQIIRHPLTGEEVGRVKGYRVEVSADIYKSAIYNHPRDCRGSWCPMGTYAKETYYQNSRFEAAGDYAGAQALYANNPDKYQQLRETGILAQKEIKDKNGKVVGYSLTTDEMLYFHIQIPLSKLHLFPNIAEKDEQGKIVGYNVNIAQAARLGLNIRSIDLAKYPVITDQLRQLLQFAGYEAKEDQPGKFDNLSRAFNRFRRDRGVKTMVGITPNINPVAWGNIFTPGPTIAAADLALLVREAIPNPLEGLLATGTEINFDDLAAQPKVMEALEKALKNLGYEVIDPLAGEATPLSLLSAFRQFCDDQKMPLDKPEDVEGEDPSAAMEKYPVNPFEALRSTGQNSPFAITATQSIASGNPRVKVNTGYKLELYRLWLLLDSAI